MKKNMPGVPESAQNEESARAFLESIVWKDGRFCPHCAALDSYKMEPKANSKKPGRKGLYRCRPWAKRKKKTKAPPQVILGGKVGEIVWNRYIMPLLRKDLTTREIGEMLGVSAMTVSRWRTAYL